MGIYGFWPTLKTKAPSCCEVVNSIDLYALRLAIDGNSLFFRLRMRARSMVATKVDIINDGIDEALVDHYWIGEILQEYIRFLNSGITPITLLDGESPPQKMKTKDIRKKSKEEQLRRITELRDNLKLNPLYPNQEDLEELVKLESQYKSMPPESISLIVQVLKDLGFPVYVCRKHVEAEKLAAKLTSLNIAVAAWSSDSDTLINYCPRLIRGYAKMGWRDASFKIVQLGKILYEFGISYQQLTDACIMAGCDYNIRTNGMTLSKTMDLMKQYGSFQTLPLFYIMSILDGYNNMMYDSCISIFKDKRLGELMELDFVYEDLPLYDKNEYHSTFNVLRWNDEHISNALLKYDMLKHKKNLITALSKLPTPFDYSGSPFPSLRLDTSHK